MKTTTKKILKIICIITIVLDIFCLTSIYFLLFHHYHGTNKIEISTSSDVFDINKIKTVEKQKDKNFIILNLADIQMCDLEDIFRMPIIHRELDYLINEIKPDLITLSGDQTWSNENFISLKVLISWLDSYKIPYAPVFGNHDYGNSKNSAVLDQNACCDLYEKGKYSLFSRGPSNLGTLGNYVVNIVEDGKIFSTLYMLDSGYEDTITDEQIAWFEWNAEGIKNANDGNYSQGMVVLHKPLPEYAMAYYDSSTEFLTPIYRYYSLSGSRQNGFFEVAKSKNVVDIICGHQHGNNFTLKYNGVRLTFALKTGELGGFISNEDIYLNGATYFVLSHQETIINNHFVDRNAFNI